MAALFEEDMSYQVLARKWRPHRFSDVVGQPHVVQALSNALEQNYLHHAYLFTGTRGVGKTTIARILAKCLNCETGISANPCDTCDTCQDINAGRFVDLFEIDAASRTKVEDIRDILDNVQYKPAKGRFKVYLIDEVHMLSGHSFNALLKTLEEPPPYVKFVLATTDYQRLPATVLSRCLQFHLSLLTVEQISDHLTTILNKEDVLFEPAALTLLAKAANGSIRDSLSLLDQSIAYGNGKVIEADVRAMLGTVEASTLYGILHALSQRNANALLTACEKLASQGADFSNALSELLNLLHQVALLQMAPGTAVEGNAAELTTLASALNAEDVQLYYQIGLMAQRDLPLAPTQRGGFEMALLRMLSFAPISYDEQQVPTAKPTATQEKVGNAADKIQTSQPNANTNNWTDLLSQLPLSGGTLALAKQCTLKEKTDSGLVLIIDENKQALISKAQIERISKALSQYMNKTMTVKIEVGTSGDTSPAELEKKLQEQQQRAAEKAIYNDQHVQKIMQTFDAKIVKSSITSNEQQ